MSPDPYFSRPHLKNKRYKLVFNDEFSGTSLDEGKWFPHMLPHWSGLDRSRAKYSLDGQHLNLLITEDQAIADDGGNRASNLQTGQWSGAKGSNDGQFHFASGLTVVEDVPQFQSYTPKFGYFELRLKAVPIEGYHTALWMIGYDEQIAGEIRCFELHGGNISSSRSRFDSAILQWNDPALTDEIYEDWVPIDASEFQVYGIEWLPDQVRFFINDMHVRTIRQSPQYKMQFMLGLYERPNEVLESGVSTPFPKICQVDYFRGYAPVTDETMGSIG